MVSEGLAPAPMKLQTYHLEIITPCFCAGADPAKAEIRAPSIRGQLRWWFRVLGGNRIEEAAIFGSVSGDCEKSSSISLRVENDSNPVFWNPPELGQNTSRSYLMYYAKNSSEGKRWGYGGALAPGHKFKIHLRFLRQLDSELTEKFNLAWSSFLAFGTIGYRSTRGMGSFCISGANLDCESNLKALTERGFLGGFSDWQGPEEEILSALGAQLRGLRSGSPGTSPGPLGGSNPRQTSAVRLRPVRLSDKKFGIIVLEAPKEKVLGLNSMRRAPRLAGKIPSPLEPPTRAKKF